VEKLLAIAPEVQSVDDLYTEDEQMKFILTYRALMRLHKKMCHYTEFSWEDLALSEQEFWDYSSKYQDLKDHINHKDQKEKISILQDIDFELELMRKDNINVSYIIQLLMKLKMQGKEEDKEKIEKQILNLLNTEVSLRSKRELIEKFMKVHLVGIKDIEDLSDEFQIFWNLEQKNAFIDLVNEENLSSDKTEKLIENYLFAERQPLTDEVLDLIEGQKPGLLQRKKLADRILQRIMDFVETFINGMAG
jgi:type I restriction enzyme R subunit